MLETSSLHQFLLKHIEKLLQPDKNLLASIFSTLQLEKNEFRNFVRAYNEIKIALKANNHLEAQEKHIKEL